MAITIASEILGQDVSATVSYCYLYEPLRINVTEDDLLAVKFYVDVELLNIADGTTADIFLRYAEFDINAGKSFTFDAMELAQQIHNANVYKIATFDDLLESAKDAIVSKYIYKFSIYSDKTESPVIVRKLPIIGGREFREFTPEVLSTQNLTEFQKYGINESELAELWAGYPFIKASLADINSPDLTPIVEKIEFPLADPCKMGVIYWKSRLGGWMFWAFELVKRTDIHAYTGEIKSKMFESTLRVGGNPFVPVDYTGVTTGYSQDLKSLSLSMDALRAVNGILATTAVYFTEDNSGRLELMKLGSVSAPIDNLANGGDFSVSMISISRMAQNTM